jgi:hypothetical protein
MYCICCEKDKVKPMNFYEEAPSSEEELLWQKEVLDDGTIRTIDNQMVSGGIIQLIDAGYGSTHDGEKFILGICDDCIRQKLENATLLYYENYMGWGTEDDVGKSKQLYRRRKNLDDLV